MSTAKPKRLRELERDLLEARTEAALLRTRATLRRLKESAALSPDWVGPYADFLERRAMSPDWLPVGGSGARRGGANYPFYQTETELNILRDLSRVVAGTNNHAAGLLRGYTSFVAGTGFKCKVTPKPDSGPVGKAAAARVTAWLEGWEKRQRWAERQQELVRRTERDGDGILRLFADEDAGELGVRFVWPEQVVQPPDSTFEEWSFGLRTDPDDRETATEMYVAGVDNPADGDYVPARDFVLFQPENDSGVKRRVPTFAFGMREVLDSAGRLTRNLGEGAAVREAIAYMRQHAAAAESDIEAANFADAAYRERVPYTDTYRPVSISEPGTVVDFPEGMELAGVPANPGSAAHSAVVDLLIRSACARLNAPEWLGSSNAANMGAYTSSLVAESPFVKGVVQVQAYYRPRLLTVVDRALALAAAAGKVRREDLDAVTVDLIPPSPEVRNKLEEAQRFQVEQQLGVDSPQRYCESVDRDFERIAEENKRAKELAGPPPGAPGAPGQPPDAGGGDPLAALGGLAESLLSDDAVEEFGLRLLEADAPPGKVWKQVNYTRGGKQYTRKQLVNAPAAAAQKPAGKKDEPKAGPAKAAKPDAAAVQKELLGHLENPAGLTPDVATALAGKLKTLTVPQVQAIQKAAGAKGGKDKAEKIARTLDAVRAKLAKAKEAPAGAPPETPAAPAAPPAANEQAAANVFHDMVGGRYANLGMVPVHEMRAAFKRANPGATDADFDNALLSLRRDDRARLIPIDDRSRATPDQLKNSIHRVGETFFYMQATPTTPAAANPPAPTGVPPETPPGPAAKPAPHAQARAALDALGVAHSHLSDEDVVSRLKAAFGAPAAKPAAKAKPAARPKAAAGRTKPAGEHLDAAAAELNALSRSDGAATVTDEAATAHLDRVLAGMTSDEVKEIARRVTNRRARTPAEARQNLHNDLTAVRRLVQSQNV